MDQALNNFIEDYAVFFSNVCPRALQLFCILLTFRNEVGAINNSIYDIVKRTHGNRKNSWNKSDKVARDLLVRLNLLHENDGVTYIDFNPLSASQRRALFMEYDLYKNIYEVLEDPILKRKAYVEAVSQSIGSKNLRNLVIEQMGLNVVEVNKALAELKNNDNARYDEIISSFKNTESNIKETLTSSIKNIKTKSGKSIKLAELSNYVIPNTVTHDPTNNKYYYEVTIENCRETGHIRNGVEIPVKDWAVFQFMKLFFDEYYKKFNVEYPLETGGVIIYKELDLPASKKKGSSVWKKTGSKTSRIFNDMSSLLSVLKDKTVTKNYIEWWFRSGIVDKKNAEYTSGWLRSSSMVSAFFKQRAVKSNTLSSDVIDRIASIPGFLEKNYGRKIESMNDVQQLLENEDFLSSDDPRVSAINILREEGLI